MTTGTKIAKLKWILQWLNTVRILATLCSLVLTRDMNNEYDVDTISIVIISGIL